MTEVDKLVANGLEALNKLKNMSQEEIDRIVHNMVIAGLDNHMLLAKMAVEETGRGVYEDKAIKNMYATEEIWNNIKDVPTAGVIGEDDSLKLKYIAEPLGVLCGVTPTTNPTSTVLFKSIISIKTRNPIIFAFHPSAQKCSAKALEVIYEEGLKHGLPENSLQYIHEPSIEATTMLMNHEGIASILATGGSGMVKSAYSTGKPALGVGPGNTPSYIEESCNIKQAVNDLIISKSFDNGMICATEQTIIVDDSIYKQVKEEFIAQGVYIATRKEAKLLQQVVMQKDKPVVNAKVVGKSAVEIAKLANIKVPETTTVIIVELNGVGEDYPLSLEKLCPVLGMVKAKDQEDGFKKCEEMLKFGAGHTATIHSTNDDIIEEFGLNMTACRILVNQPASLGGIGDLYNNMTPSLTLGCGSYGHNSISHNVSVNDLLNIKTVSIRRNNMQWSKVPPKIYFEENSVNYLAEMQNIGKVFIVSDRAMQSLGFINRLKSVLNKNKNVKDIEVYTNVEPDPSIQTVEDGYKRMCIFEPDCIIALGGGSVMDASKGMKMLYDGNKPSKGGDITDKRNTFNGKEEGISFYGAKQKFLDIRKRAYKFPESSATKLVCIPTTSSTGSEVTAFAVITDGETGIKYPLADYALTPDVAIIDSQFVLTVPQKVRAEGIIDTLCHATESYVSVMASEYTKGLSLEAIKGVYNYGKKAYDGDKEAIEKMHNIATIAGEAFTSALLGINHSIAHKLGGAFHLPHGRCIGAMQPLVIEYNAFNPTKRTPWAKYNVYRADEDYAEIAKALGLTGETTEELVYAYINYVKELSKYLGIELHLGNYGINREEFESQVAFLAEEAYHDNCTATNPRQPLIKEMEELIKRAY